MVLDYDATVHYTKTSVLVDLVISSVFVTTPPSLVIWITGSAPTAHWVTKTRVESPVEEPPRSGDIHGQVQRD